MSVEQWAAFLAAASLVAVSPGANNLLSLRTALQQGARDAVVGLAGRFTAFALLAAATATGLGALLLASETAFTALKWCGVGYLLVLGLRTLWGARAPRTPDEEEAAASPSQRRRHRGRARLVREEFLVAMTNPKAMLVFAAFLPQFADPARPLLPQLLALAAGYLAVEFAAALGYAYAGGRLSALRLTARVRRRFDQATGGAFLLMAGGLAAQRH
ncbi:LysE family translocator [Marinitenerispora sediminis]|uniref:LysE family translocator n=1 Tax=Marinitenerispora sediminis TaxID=1931232 RepID=A0A368SZE1_9ACTN|nr:LysE family translocator [Marinitenerispora sediminis]RCV50928.1 LysE family translocator [Marinitenerispora sediminis]RCV57935.1 LysE family translocator [Marinitenerispora sediminis]RCV62332.1 LysE family translocator [Marinitenerispora sediminis]